MEKTPICILIISRFLLRKLFKGGNYSREETIWGNTVYIYGCFFHSFCATDLNFGTKNNGGMKYSTLKTVIFASYWGSPLVQFSKFKNFLWVCWFLCKNLSNFVSLPWKFHNPVAYCHNQYSVSAFLRAKNWWNQRNVIHNF